MQTRYRIRILGIILVLLLGSTGCISISKPLSSATKARADMAMQSKHHGHSIRQTNDPSELRAFFGDLLYTNRYADDISGELKERFAHTDIGNPLVLAWQGDSIEYAYLPLMQQDQLQAMGMLRLWDGRWYYDQISEDEKDRMLFAIDQNRILHLLSDAMIQRTYFKIDPSLFGSNHGVTQPLCLVETNRGRFYYLYRSDVVVEASHFQRKAFNLK